jgi:hypothetical protein
MEPPPLTSLQKGGGGGAPYIGCSTDSVESRDDTGLWPDVVGLTFPAVNYRELAPPIRGRLSRQGRGNGKRRVHKLRNGAMGKLQSRPRGTITFWEQ